jgi:hypothetical protein
MESKKLRMFKNEQEVLDNMAECDRQERLQGLDPYSPEAEEALETWRPAGVARNG